MEKNIDLKTNTENFIKNKFKNKILYKFKILDNNPKLYNHINRCYLINLNISNKKFFSLQKNKLKKYNPTKLPLITLNDYSNQNFKTITLSNSKKILDNQIYKYSENNESNTIPINYDKPYKNKINFKSTISLTETSSNKNNNNMKKYNEIIDKINQRYFAKNSTMKFLSNIFNDKENHDLKMINLSKIKNKKPKEIDNNEKNNIKINKVNKNSSYFDKMPMRKKLNSFNEKSCDNAIIDMHKINRSILEERLKKFKYLKLKKSKMMVDNAIKDLLKEKEKNLVYIENFRKSCDFKFEDF